MCHPLILSLYINIPFYTSQAIVAASILQAYQQQAQQMQAGMLGIPNLTSTTSQGSMQPQANIPNLNMLLAASMTQGGNTIPPQANVQNASDPTQASAAALFSQLSNISQVQQPPVQDYAALMNNMIQSQNLYNPVVQAPQFPFPQNPLASSFVSLAPIQPPIQQQPSNQQPPNQQQQQQQQTQDQSSIQQQQEDPQEERQGEDQAEQTKK